MPLKVVVNSLDEVAEPLRALYTQVGDEYVLDTEDGDYKNKISEFRNNNIELSRQLKDAESAKKRLGELQKKLDAFGTLTPDEAREAHDKMQQIAEQKLIDAGKLDEVVAQRVERMRQDYEGRITALDKALNSTKTDADSLRQKLTEVVIDNSLQRAVGGVATVRRGAMQDVLSRGRQTWTLDDTGNPVPKDPTGNVIYGKDPSKMLSMEEWAQSLVKDAGYLFEPSAGGGGAGNSGGGGSGGSVVSSSDSDALSANLEAIAAGTVKVVAGN